MNRLYKVIGATLIGVVAVLGMQIVNTVTEQRPDIPSPGILVWRVVHQECGHHSDTSVHLGNQWPDLDELIDGWTIIFQDDEKIIVSREEPGLCAEDKTFRHLVLEENEVVVYLGQPRDDAIEDRRIPVDLSWLLPEDIERLIDGFIVVGDDGVDSYLEGLGD